MRVFAITIALLACFNLSTRAYAEPPSASEVEGRVIQVANGELVIDLGSERGLDEKAEVDIYRWLEVTHPVTKKKIQDRFPIGRIELNQVGTRLSIASNFSGLSTAPKPGDFVLFHVPQQEAKPKVSTGASVVLTPPASTPMDLAFQDTLGQPLTERIAIWDDYLARHPDSEHASAVAHELQWLRAQLTTVRTSTSRLAEQQEDLNKTGGRTALTTRAPIGSPIQVVAAFDAPQNVDVARAFVRISDQATFTEVAMKQMGDNSWGATLPEEFAESAQQLEVQVESVRTDGQLEKSEGNTLVEIYEPPRDPAPVHDLSRASIRSEFVNFKLGDQADQYWRVESDYLYRLDLPYLAAFKVGAGLYSGTGMSLQSYEENQAPEDLSVGYGFAETLFEWKEVFGWTLALQLGNRRGGGDQLRSSMGLRVALRLGHWDRTRLETGASVTEGIGSEAWIRLDLLEIPKIPMKAEVIVTNLPVGEDGGVILNYGAGYELTENFTLLAHVGWNARTIQHHGPGAGLSMIAQW